VSHRRGPLPWKLTSESLAALLQAYLDGDKTEAIAAQYGISRGYVPMLARRAGLPRRPVGRNPMEPAE